MPFPKVTASSAALAGTVALALSGAAVAAPGQTRGPVQFFGTQQGNKTPYDVVTGAINDSGKDVSVGTSSEKIILKKGTFLIDTTKLNKSFKFKRNKAGCSGTSTASATALRLSHGTGAYAGITGRFTIHADFVVIGKVVRGKCNVSKETAGNGVIMGTGHVSY